jgi:serine/threonine protein phosphatase PrpC
MTGSALRLTHGARSDVGLVRQANEDSYIERPDIGLWAVADGMGGYENGAWASGTIVEALQAVTAGGDFDGDAAEVAQAIHKANTTINDQVQATGHNMGSTVAALMIQGKQFVVFWAGDSRVYLLRDGQLYRMSQDHTQVQDMVDRGLLTPEEAVEHPMRHVISRAVGVEPALEIDAIADEAAVGDVFMICSDGLHGLVQDEEIGGALAMHPADAAKHLVELSLSRGAPDNVTVVVVACDETTLLVPGHAEVSPP